MTAIDKYSRRTDAVHSLLCVGLDPEFEKIPEKFKRHEYPQFEFNKYVIEETHEYAAAYKMNVAFYEERGAEGMHELKMTIDYLRLHHPDIFTIVDVKRGDIENTNAAYARSYYDFFGFDATTMQPYMGQEPLKPFLDRADKMCFILCRTSNPGAGEFQDMIVEGKPLWMVVAKKVRDEWNINMNCGLVVGASYPEELKKLRELMGEMTFLTPGAGPQGGELQKFVKAGLNAEKKGMIINASRSIIFAEHPREAAEKLRDEINSYRFREHP